MWLYNTQYQHRFLFFSAIWKDVQSASLFTYHVRVGKGLPSTCTNSVTVSPSVTSWSDSSSINLGTSNSTLISSPFFTVSSSNVNCGIMGKTMYCELWVINVLWIMGKTMYYELWVIMYYELWVNIILSLSKMKKDKICIELTSPTNGSDLNTSYSLIEYGFLFIHQRFTQLIVHDYP